MNINESTSTRELNDFLRANDEQYKKQVALIDLFKPGQASALNKQQKTLFAGVFYHIRGHFHDFLWYMLNNCPNEHYKNLVIENVVEEAGGAGLSHEAQYGLFAQEYNVDINKEYHAPEYYLPFVKAFNEGHISWLAANDFETCFSAYSAYERLDNIDYNVLFDVVKDFGTSRKGLCFFEVHKNVEHFETTETDLIEIWQRSPEKVKKGYEFIFSHQLKIWQDLSDLIYSEALEKSA